MTTTTTPIRGQVNGSGALVSALQISAQPCLVTRLFVRNNSAGTLHLQLHNTASTPADGQTPAYPSVSIEAGQHYETDVARTFTTGCYACLSSSASVKALAGADMQITAITA